jgi:hypothetical protein
MFYKLYFEKSGGVTGISLRNHYNKKNKWNNETTSAKYY